MIGKSDEFRAQFKSSRDHDSAQSNTVRVRTSFLQDVIEGASAAGNLLDASITTSCASFPTTTKQSLQKTLASLFSELNSLKPSLEKPAAPSNLDISWKALRSMLLG